MSVDADQFRAVLAQWPSGVTVVTCTVGGAWHGLTASSFSSVSVDPPLVLVCIARNAFAHDLLTHAGGFAISILAKDQSHVGKRFARYDPALAQRFDEGEWLPTDGGSPVHRSCLGWLDCQIADRHDGGDHTILVGHVTGAGTPRQTAPLLYHLRAWGQSADILPERVALLDAASGPGDVVIEVCDPQLRPDDAAARVPGDGAGRVVLAGAFSSDPERVGAIAAAVGHDRPGVIVLADDTGVASPIAVREVCREARLGAGNTPVAVRLADTDGFGVANLLVALKSGVHLVEVGAPAITRERAMQLLERMQLPVEVTI